MLSKKILTTTIFAALGLTGVLFTTGANAALPGIYVGGQLGYGNTYYSSSDIAPFNVSSVEKDGLAGRINLGYQFTPNWAAELGYTRFSNSKFRNVSYNFDNVTYNLGNLNIKQEAVDLMGKATLPLPNNFDIFGKLGVAYVIANANVRSDLGSYDSSEKVFRPAFGAGASYNITPNLPVSVSWTRYQKTGSSDIPSSDFFGVGLDWHFG